MNYLLDTVLQLSRAGLKLCFFLIPIGLHILKSKVRQKY